MAAVAAGNGMMSHGPASHGLSSSFFATSVSRHGHPTMVGSPVTGIHSSGGNSVLGGFSRTPSSSLGSQRGLSVSHMSASGIMPSSRSNMPTVVVHQRWGRVLCLMSEVLAHSAFSQKSPRLLSADRLVASWQCQANCREIFITRLSYYLSPFASLLLLTDASHRRAWFPSMLEWIAEIVDHGVFKKSVCFLTSRWEIEVSQPSVQENPIARFGVILATD